MNDKKRDLLIFLVAIILFDLLSWFVFKSNLISIFMSNMIMGIVFFQVEKCIFTNCLDGACSTTGLSDYICF
ncbi:hypothetical protein [Lactococcus lactis]|uniref:Uncharacterized protein n=1 Tax=Lactococcus lactis subsp. hordniae TaxID=203404 RepID=A0A5M9Q4W9_LACLH|nr:hypothetical protein [Lactococcus lactis]KAA8703614.1 hypothetical protein F4V48_04590 [Lactococcus lactis subsp. hordniae]MCT3133979.1 hypothetical protein [Lactococcus lactis]